jgi:hypothetical protein
MTSKEKAEELVNKYRMIFMGEDTDCGNEILCSLVAIKNSHIAVDEVLEFMDKFNIGLPLQYFGWHEVKIELDAM